MPEVGSGSYFGFLSFFYTTWLVTDACKVTWENATKNERLLDTLWVGCPHSPWQDQPNACISAHKCLRWGPICGTTYFTYKD